MWFFKKFHYYYTNIDDSLLGKNIFHEIYIFIDYLFNFLIQGSSLTNYFIYSFYSLKNAEKRKYVTWRRQRWIYRQCNDPDYIHKLRDKNLINEIFGDYLMRDWLLPDEKTFEQFAQFVADNPVFIAKPALGTEGAGVKKFDVTAADEAALQAIYEELQGKQYLLERYIKQHPQIHSLHPQSVNTIRLTTIRNRDGVNILTAALRMGRADSVVDNYTTGGIVASVDLATGIVSSRGVDKMHHEFIVHPDTNEAIIGRQIPKWEEVKAFVKKLGEVVPQVRYTGWDIAITEDGPVLLEGNYQGNFHVQQHPDHTGKFKLFKETIKRI